VAEGTGLLRAFSLFRGRPPRPGESFPARLLSRPSRRYFRLSPLQSASSVAACSQKCYRRATLRRKPIGLEQQCLSVSEGRVGEPLCSVIRGVLIGDPARAPPVLPL
jgi:hypothetical protein